MKEISCPNCYNITLISDELQDLLFCTTAIIGINCSNCNAVMHRDYVKANMSWHYIITIKTIGYQNIKKIYLHGLKEINQPGNKQI